MPFAKCSDVSIYYEAAGHGPGLLLINGLGCDTRTWEPLIRQLKEHFTVISFDMRGAGKSDKPQGPYSIPQLSDDVIALLKHLGIDKINVLGFSMGGFVAQDLAVHHPNMVDGLVLVSTAPSWRRPYPPSRSVDELMHRTDISDELLGAVYDIVFGPAFKERVSLKNYIAVRITDDNPQPADAYLSQLAAAESFDLYDRAGEIRAKTIIVNGDSDRVIDPRNSAWLDQNIKSSKLFSIKGIGHTVPLEAPKELAEIIIKNLLSCLDL